MFFFSFLILSSLLTPLSLLYLPPFPAGNTLEKGWQRCRDPEVRKCGNGRRPRARGTVTEHHFNSCAFAPLTVTTLTRGAEWLSTWEDENVDKAWATLSEKFKLLQLEQLFDALKLTFFITI